MGCADHDASLAALGENSAALREVAGRLAAAEVEMRHVQEQREAVSALLVEHHALHEREVAAAEKAAEADRRRAVAAEQWARIPAGVLDVLSKLVSTKSGIALLALVVGIVAVVVVGRISDVGWDRVIQAIEVYQCPQSP